MTQRSSLEPAVFSAASPSFAAPLWRVGATPELREQWRGLACEAGEPNPFFEEWALLPALEQFDAAGEVRFATLHAAGRLVGLAPIVHARRYYGRPLPHWTIWLHANAFVGAPLIARGFEPAFWAALLDWCDDRPGLSPWLHCPALPGEATPGALQAAARSQARPAAVVQETQRALLHSPLAPEAYFERAMSAKKRKELRRQAKRLGEEGQLCFAREDGAAGLDVWIAAFLDLEARGWKGAGGSALAEATETTRFFRAALTGAAAAGRLERLSLTLDGRPIAMLANFLCPPGAFAFKTAYDEEFARFSPGVLLQRENLDLLARPDIAWCDSCAAAGHPMIERIWREKRTVSSVNVALGGPLRRQLAHAMMRIEARRATRPTRADAAKED